MPMGSDMLKATEAAVVSRVALRDVYRVIDEDILPREFFTLGDGLHALAAACTLISFYFESAKSYVGRTPVCHQGGWASPSKI